MKNRGLIVISVVAVAALLLSAVIIRHARSSSSVAVTVPSAAATTPSATLAAYAVPSGWQHYDTGYGFSFSYPASWNVDDTELTPFSTLHSAFLNYSNLVTAYSSQAAESDPTQGPSLTMTVASLADQEALLHTTFQTSQEWVQHISTGLPPKATVSTMQINGVTAIRIQGLIAVVGKYEVVYLLDSVHRAVVRFDYFYDQASDTQVLDTIAQSFAFSKTF